MLKTIPEHVIIWIFLISLVVVTSTYYFIEKPTTSTTTTSSTTTSIAISETTTIEEATTISTTSTVTTTTTAETTTTTILAVSTSVSTTSTSTITIIPCLLGCEECTSDSECCSGYCDNSTCRPEFCYALSNLITDSWASSCGDLQYNPIADISKDGVIDILDGMQVSINWCNEIWCQETMENMTSPCCQILFDLVTDKYELECADPDYDPVADITKDGIIDIFDSVAALVNIDNDTWCQERQGDTTDPCATTTTIS